MLDNVTLHTLPGSNFSFTRAQIANRYGPADWFPEDHPKPPDIVMTGRRPDARACGLCHYPNGRGRPENAGIDGLPVAYFTQQIADFKNGTEDAGFYNLNGTLQFYNYGGGPNTVLQPNVYVMAVLTRDASGTLTGYVDGVQQFQLADTGNHVIRVVDVSPSGSGSVTATFRTT